MNEFENLDEVLSASEIDFFKSCLSAFDRMKDYYLNLSESFGLKNETLLLDLKNKAECFISASNFLELTIRRIIEQRIIESKHSETIENKNVNSY